jgi:hypothetical protein
VRLTEWKSAQARASFDVASSAHRVVFAADHSAVARELGQVCRPGGRLGLTYGFRTPSWPG